MVFDFNIQVGFTVNGKIKALDVTLYSNAGNSLDLSSGVSYFIFLLSYLNAGLFAQAFLFLESPENVLGPKSHA